MKTLYKLSKIALYILPGAFTFHFLMMILKDLDVITAGVIALCLAIYVSVWSYNSFQGLLKPKKAVKAKARRTTKGNNGDVVVMSYAKAKAKGLV